MKRYVMIAASCLALAGCRGDPAPTATEEENLNARGEVLGGTISDAMLPLDTITSQPPAQAEEVDQPEPGDTPEPSAVTQDTPAEAEQTIEARDSDVEPVE